LQVTQNRKFILPILYLIFLAGGSLTPIPVKTEIISGGDKAIHLILYIPLGYLLSFSKISSLFLLNFSIPFSLGTLYGGVLELLQNYIPGRSASFYDALANSLGVGIGLILGQAGGLANRKRGKLKIL